jgi:phage/conjugal plasmid C-4 type zinc finger TraR family protein
VSYIGDASMHAQQAAIDSVDNLVDEARAELYTGPSLTHCDDCGDKIPEARRKAIPCTRCISCQEAYDSRPKSRVRLLDHIL